MYLNYSNTSVLLILTEELSFLIVQKIFEENIEKENENNYIEYI